MINMSYADLRAADLDWIARLGYSYGWYILGCSQRLASRFQRSARMVKKRDVIHRGPHLTSFEKCVVIHVASQLSF